MSMQTEQDAAPFLPDDRQRRLIEEASKLNQSSLEIVTCPLPPYQ